jgi:hypothetical protein
MAHGVAKRSMRSVRCGLGACSYRCDCTQRTHHFTHNNINTDYTNAEKTRRTSELEECSEDNERSTQLVRSRSFSISMHVKAHCYHNRNLSWAVSVSAL